MDIILDKTMLNKCLDLIDNILVHVEVVVLLVHVVEVVVVLVVVVVVQVVCYVRYYTKTKRSFSNNF